MVQIAHPAHVHFYKHVIRELQRDGYTVTVLARDKEMTVGLLEEYDIDHHVLTSQNGRVSPHEHLAYLYKTYRYVKQYDPAFITGIGGITAAQVSALTDVTSLLFTDSENATMQNRLAFPFADWVFTPESYREDIGSNQIRYPSYHELAYLHPNRFDPDPAVLREHGVDPNDQYSVLRFVNWGAVHDAGLEGFRDDHKRTLLETLTERGDVYITSEDPLPTAFEPYRLPVPPHEIHHLLAFADLYVGESGTMATEAAVLGTPAVRYRTLESHADPGNFHELEDRYGLLRSRSAPEDVLQEAATLIDDESASRRFQQNRSRLLEDKIDATTFLVDTFEDACQHAAGTNRREPESRLHSSI